MQGFTKSQRDLAALGELTQQTTDEGKEAFKLYLEYKEELEIRKHKSE